MTRLLSPCLFNLYAEYIMQNVQLNESQAGIKIVRRNINNQIWRRKWHPTPVLLPGKPHGRRNLVGYSLWGHKESDRTEQLHFHFHFLSLQICRWYHSNARKWRGAKELLDEGERGEWKSWLKTHIQKSMIMASSPITSWQIEGEKLEAVIDFLPWLHSHCRQ